MKASNTPSIVKIQLALGWFLISLIILSAITTIKFIYPNDQELRLTPKIGDLVSLNREAIDKTGEFLSHPFTLARVTAVRDDDLTLVVSKWQFPDQFSLMKDFLAQKDQLNSYFLNNKIILSRDLLNDKTITPVVRRRNANYDREKIHSTNFFK
ncbi:hypothetical protein N9L48_01065 [Psychrosphaera sp.]|nr:hypothetical protein [Psychrosphaera sp.]